VTAKAGGDPRGARTAADPPARRCRADRRYPRSLRDAQTIRPPSADRAARRAHRSPPERVTSPGRSIGAGPSRVLSGQLEAATPPLTCRGCAAHCPGPPLQPQDLLRTARCAPAFGRVLTLEPLRPLRAGGRGQARGLPDWRATHQRRRASCSILCWNTAMKQQQAPVWLGFPMQCRAR
jgi:hypothetical protein